MGNEITVCKFGGTSLANVQNIKKVRDIIKADPRRSVIVVSAPGKRNPDDTKITDILFDIYHRKEAGKSFDEPYNIFAERFRDIAKAFKLSDALQGEIEEKLLEFYNELRDKNADFITSTGEYFMAQVMAAILGYEFIDIDKSHVIAFDKHGNVDLERSAKAYAQFRGKKIVIPGFYGIMEDLSIKTFPRGGSDITGAIVANLANADLYENWTDVDGVFDCDPNKHKEAKHIPIITYDQIESLARAGANVLHPDSVHFARLKNIPIRIMNTFNPTGKNTIIK